MKRALPTILVLSALFCLCGVALAVPPALPPNPMTPTMSTPDRESSSEFSPTSAARTSARLAAYVAAPEQYMPLRKGNRWDYDVVVRAAADEPRAVKATRVVKGMQSVADVEYFRLVTEVKEGALRVPDQFYRYGEQGLLAAAQGAPGKELLVLPKAPEQQSTWSGKAEPSVAQYAGTATMGEVVRCGEHEYRDCLQVTLTMTIVETSFFGGKTETPARVQRWFAPGVGMVRELRQIGEHGKDSYLETDSKLTQFQPGE